VGELLRISEGENVSSSFRLNSKHICDAPAGTIGGLHGNVMHAGTGATEGDTRNVLFWTHSKIGACNGNTQHTKLTVVVELIIVLWKSSNFQLRLDLLKLLYCCFSTVNTSYQKTCSGTFHRFPKMTQLLVDLNKQNEKKDDHEQHKNDVLRLLESHCRGDDFFKDKTQEKQRSNRKAKRDGLRKTQT